MKLFLRSLSLFALIGMLALPGTSRAEAVNVKKGHLVIEDSAELFSDKGKEKARDEFAHLMTKSQREVTVSTMAKLSEDDRAKFDKTPASERKTFWVDLAKKRATGTHGVYVLICRSPGEVVIIADKEMRDKGFKTSHEDDVRDILLKGLREAAGKEKTPAEQTAARDKALFSAVESLEKNLPAASKDVIPGKTTTTTTRNGNNVAHNNNDAHNDGAKGSGMGIGSWICIGLVALLGIWLVVGIIRSFSGGGAGGGGMMGGGGGGMMGGGGGGFFPSLMGGLFGAAAGMWMYDHFFGGHSSAAYGGDTYNTTNNYGEQTNDAGAGDYSGDTGSAGSYDENQGGGGGGGDGGWGGGGDFGGGDGGGGDWGGGGDDF